MGAVCSTKPRWRSPRSGKNKDRAMSVQSVERTFAILELLERNGGDVSLSELAGASDIPLPTIHRLLKTLVKLGYVRQLMNRRYALGARLVRLGEGATRQ